MPAPKNNLNAMTNGVRRSHDASVAGYRQRRMPKGCKYLAGEASRFATGLAAEIEEIFSEPINSEQKAIIEAASAWHLHHAFVMRVLRIDFETLKPTEKVQLSSEAAKAAQRRSDLVKSLNLRDAKHAGEADWFNGTLPSPANPQNNTTGQGASAADTVLAVDDPLALAGREINAAQ